ncbi:MAG: hypothetical protein P4L76_10790 [Beijerinckiaceae bacterium]|nr:hypothetical protein [Beijerinckiaceae bacterium]
MRIISTFTLAAVAVALLMSPIAHAQPPEDDDALRKNCVGDYFRFCSSYMPGSQEIHQCFAAKIDLLTPGCRGAIHDFDRRNSRHS